MRTLSFKLIDPTFSSGFVKVTVVVETKTRLPITFDNFYEVVSH